MADQVTTSLAEAKVLVMEGKAGYSPQIEVRDVTGGHQIRITTKISSTQYQTDVFNVMDGKDGEPGSPGAPGFSPTVSVQDITEPIPGGGTKVIGHTVTITDATGAHSFNVMNGEDGEGGGSDYDPDEELAKAYKLTVSGTTVTLNDTAVNVSAAIQSARPVLFYTESGGEFTFFGVSSMNYSTGAIKLTTFYSSGSAQSVTLRPSGSTMTGTLETTELSAEVASLSRLVYALSVSGATATLAASFSDFYAQYSKGLTPIIYLPYGGGTTDPIAMEMRVAYVDALERSIALVGEHNGSRYTVTLTQSGITMAGTLVATPIPAAVTEQTVAGWGFTKNTGDYTKPSTGIPKSDLASDVQTSLGKADTAYQKPSGGIPASDLASGVIPVVPQMATQAGMSDWTSGKTVDAATLKTNFIGALTLLSEKASQTQVDALASVLDDVQTAVGQKANASDIPTKTSDLANDSGYQTAAQASAAISTATASKAEKTLRVAMTSSDTTPTLDTNKLYVFPTMASLTPTLNAPSDNSIVNEYHFIFSSGATATTLTIPATINQPDGFTVEANHVYEVSILEGCMTAQGWAVS